VVVPKWREESVWPSSDRLIGVRCLDRAFGTAQGEPNHEKVVDIVDRESDKSDSLRWRDRNDVVVGGTVSGMTSRLSMPNDQLHASQSK
jgi:hypothetical protein